LQNLTGTRFQHVPYRGSAPAMQDLVAGPDRHDVRRAVDHSGRRCVLDDKAYAVMAKSRFGDGTRHPNGREAGLPGFYVSNWFALWAPKAHLDVIARLSGAIVDALADPSVRLRFADLGFDVPPREQQTPEPSPLFTIRERKMVANPQWRRTSRGVTAAAGTFHHCRYGNARRFNICSESFSSVMLH